MEDKIICPSGASTANLLSTKVAMVEAVVVMLAKLLLPTKFKVMESPAAITTVPAWASTTPAF